MERKNNIIINGVLPMEKIFNEILSKLTSIENSLQDLKQGQLRIEEKINNINIKIDDLEPKNATRHSEINLNIDALSKDMKFIKNKLHETDEGVFDIKDYLKIIK